jgi:hypothetical protein
MSKKGIHRGLPSVDLHKNILRQTRRGNRFIQGLPGRELVLHARPRRA